MIKSMLCLQIVQLERERALKWSKMVANWPKYNGSDQLYRRINKGIPNSIRGEVWKHVLEIDKVKHSDIFEVGMVSGHEVGVGMVSGHRVGVKMVSGHGLG